jgi:uncharacterized OsmC-like protein
MKASVVWKEKMLFEGEAAGNRVLLDAKAPLGGGQGLTPKELVGLGLVGCTGDVEAEKLVEAVRLSQTKYCGVSAMLAQAFPLRYRVVLNGQEIATGEAKF